MQQQCNIGSQQYKHHLRGMYHRSTIIVQTDGWDGSLGEVRYRAPYGAKNNANWTEKGSVKSGKPK